MIRLIIAEDQGMLRSAIATLLGFEEDMEIIGTASTGIETLKLISDTKPDIAILDIEMPGISGLGVARRLKEEGSDCKIVIVTTFNRKSYFREALACEVFGYLLKDTPSDDLADALRQIQKGKRIFSPELSYDTLQNENPLTEKEIKVLKLASEGMTSKEIAKNMHFSEGTVRNYISVVLQKLDAKNRIEAISIAQEQGWMTSN